MGKPTKSETDGMFTGTLPPGELTYVPQPPPVKLLPPRAQVALSITAPFEGKGFGQVTGDFDGQGLSVGALQWNFGQGSLQKNILQPYILRHGSTWHLGIFPDNIDHLGTATPPVAVDWVRRHMLNGTRVRGEWVNAWTKFLLKPEVIRIQVEAAHAVELQADKMMDSLGLASLRAFCWCFDIAVQNGSLKGVTLAKPDRKVALGCITSPVPSGIAGAEDLKANQTLWVPMLRDVSDEQVSLLIMSRQRALLANPTYLADVFNRKATIAMGVGYVHRTKYVLMELDPIQIVP